MVHVGPEWSHGMEYDDTFFFLEHAGELRIIILKERKVRNGPKYNAITGKNKKKTTQCSLMHLDKP
jgi:hypothetical protein